MAKKRLEDYFDDKNKDIILNIVNYYDYSLSIHHFSTLYDIFKKTNKLRNFEDYKCNSDLTDLNQLWLISIIINKEIDPCPRVAPTQIQCCITEKWSRLIRNCDERLHKNWIWRIFIPRYKKIDMPIIISFISFFIAILSLIISLIK